MELNQDEKAPLLGLQPQRYRTGSHSDQESDQPHRNGGFRETSSGCTSETVAEESYEHTRSFCACLPVVWLNAFLALFTLITLSFKTIVLPAYITAVTNAGSDPFSVALIAAFWFQVFFFLVTIFYKLFVDSTLNLMATTKWKFLLVAGFCNGLAGVPLVFASDPNRTPPYLQALLSTIVIPFTVIFRYLLLGKVVGVKRLLCALAVIVGLVLSLVPQFTGAEQHPTEMCTSEYPTPPFTCNATQYSKQNQLVLGAGVMTACLRWDPSPLWYRLLWPFIFALGFVPIAIMYVLAEMEMKKSEVRSFTFLLWLHILTFLTLVCLFWTDLIPGFGMADSLEDFWNKLVAGLTCHVSVEPQCENVVATSWMYILGNCLNMLFMLLLTRHGEGSVYPTVVSAVSTPLSALFWTMFILDPFYAWAPSFNVTTIFIIGGLVVMVPAVVLYNIFSIKDENKKRLSRVSSRPSENVS